jgi:hypothetical protein
MNKAFSGLIYSFIFYPGWKMGKRRDGPGTQGKIKQIFIVSINHAVL